MTAFSTLGQYRSRAHGIDSWFLDSVAGTLDSIRLCLSRGHVSDAYGLLRSVIERTWLHIFLLERSSSDELSFEVNVDDPEAFANSILTLFGTEDWYDRAIEDWVTGRQSLPNLREIRPSLQLSQSMHELNALFLPTQDKDISDRCNDHLHVNFAKNLVVHYDRYQTDKLSARATQVESDLRFVITKHLTHLFFFRQNYMASSDYIDSLELGLEPEEDSQYWVAPVIQEFFDKEVSPTRRDVITFLQKHTSMKLV